jgi:hypothetical protein
MKTKFFLLLIVVSLLAGGCMNHEDAREGIAVKMRAVTNFSSINSPGKVSAKGFMFDKVLMGVRELEFELEDDEGIDEDEIEFEGYFVVDLLKGTSVPDFGVARVQPGLYEEVEIETEGILANKNTVFISFTHMANGISTTRVEFSTKEEIEFEIECDRGFQVQDNVLTTIFLLLNLDSVFAGIDLSQAQADLDGVIRINDLSNTHLAGLIKSNLKRSFKAGEDRDHDDDFDDDD